MATFAINGLLVGTSAVLAASRFGSAAPTFGVGFELDVIAPVVLGGVAFTGGEGNIPGVLLAVALLGVINSGLISLASIPITRKSLRGARLLLPLPSIKSRRSNRSAIAESWRWKNAHKSCFSGWSRRHRRAKT